MGISPPDKYGYIRIDGVRHRTKACHPENCDCPRCLEMRELNSQDREYDYIGVAGSKTKKKSGRNWNGGNGSAVSGSSLNDIYGNGSEHVTDTHSILSINDWKRIIDHNRDLDSVWQNEWLKKLKQYERLTDKKVKTLLDKKKIKDLRHELLKY